MSAHLSSESVGVKALIKHLLYEKLIDIFLRVAGAGILLLRDVWTA